MAQADISRYRKSPRPTYYNALTKTPVPISLDCETWLLRMSGISKRTLISRLQKSLSISRINGARDNLAKKALENQASNSGSAVIEYDASLGEFQVFLQDQLSNANNVVEASMIVSDIGRSYGESLAARDQENNALIASNFMYGRIGGTDNKQQIQSWIEIITQYVIPE